MANKSSNKMLYILAGVALVVCIPFLMTDRGEKFEPMVSLPVSVNPTGDTTQDTIEGLQAEIEKSNETTKLVIKKNDLLIARAEDESNSIASLKNQAKQSSQKDQEMAWLLDKTEKSLTSLQRLSAQQSQQITALQSKEPTSAGGMPVGLGYDSPEAISSRGTWLTPLDAVEDEDKGGSNRLFGSRSSRSVQQATQFPVKSKTKEERIIKKLTMPATGAGIDSVAWTALVGRIPVKGKIPDAYPAKFIMGKETLLANGHNLQDVHAAIWEGKAKGDWNLSCVSVDLYVVTFIFEDGTISTTRVDEGENPLGWISDETGFPCVEGEFVTNAPAFLAQRAGLTALGVAGAAYAEAQQTTGQNALGGSSSFVSGDTGKFVLGEAVGGTTKEVNAWLLERQQGSFDAVVTKPNTKVGIHFSVEIQIDYDPKGRKVRHESYAQSRYSVLD